MKTRRKKRFTTTAKVHGIHIVCELFRVPVTAAGAAVFERKIREAAAEVYPDLTIRGLWVHKGIKMTEIDTGALR